MYSTPPLKKGVYTVSVQYEADNDAYDLRCTTDETGGSYPIIFAEEYQLSSQQDSLVFPLWVNSDIDYLLVCVETEQPAESICIDQINLKRSPFRKTFVYLMLKVCIWLLALDVILIFVWKWAILCHRIKSHFFVLLGLACIFAIISFPVTSAYQTAGHDLQFHWARIVGLAEGLTTGDFPVRIQQGWCNGYGYAVSVFYGDILLYIPAILYAWGIPLIYVYKFYVLCINAATIAISYFCYKRLSQNKYIGLVCAALYCISIYRIVNINLRMAVGEYSAYMFLPLVLLGTKEIFDTGGDEHFKKYGWMYLCIGMTGIVQTHVITFEMTCILLGMAVIVLYRRLLNKKILFVFLKCIAVTICLNISFLLPFLDYSGQDIQIMNGGGYGIQSQGLSLYELFSVPVSGSGDAKAVIDGVHGRIPISLGIGLICIIILAVILLAKCAWNPSEKKQLLFVVGLAGVTVFMSTYYCPWNRLAAIPFISKIESSIQFPWRFISVAMPILTYVACLVFMKIKKLVAWDKMKLLLVGICVLAAIQGLYCTDQIERSGENYIKYDGHDILEAEESLYGAEYLLENTDIKRLYEETDVVGQDVIINNIERNGNRFKIFCEAGQNAYLEFPVFAYKYYRCTDIQTGEEFPITRGDNNKVHVGLPDNYRGNLLIHFAEPWYWRTAEVISLVTMIMLILYRISFIVIERRHRHVYVSKQNTL